MFLLKGYRTRCREGKRRRKGEVPEKHSITAAPRGAHRSGRWIDRAAGSEEPARLWGPAGRHSRALGSGLSGTGAEGWLRAQNGPVLKAQNGPVLRAGSGHRTGRCRGLAQAAQESGGGLGAGRDRPGGERAEHGMVAVTRHLGEAGKQEDGE
ncbi:unnamed protein product [Coccothraustes coccothraustes]